MINLRIGKYLGVWAFLAGLLLFGFNQETQAQEREFRDREFRDKSYDRERAYPARGQFVDVLPSGHRVVFFRKARYFFFEGVWYRPEGRRFRIVAPPVGLVVPVLPLYYKTILVGDIPYFFANEVFYRQSPRGYVVVDPPRSEIFPGPPPTSVGPVGPPPLGPPPNTPVPPAPMPAAQTPPKQLFIYPRQGQSPQKQASDRLECHNWAVSQTGFDPAKPPTGLPEMQMIQKEDDFYRAQGACLDGRGYTVR